MANAPLDAGHARIRPATTLRVVLLCFITILFEGYDVGVMGAIIPMLKDYQPWSLSPVQLGALASYALVGMFVGGLFAGTLSDIVGRKKMLIGCLALFSISMIGVAMAPTPTWFAVFRFAGGLGLGGVIPVCAATTVEYSPGPHRSRNYGLMYAGYALGIMCAGIVARAVLTDAGWRTVLGFGALSLVLVPICAWLLPESIEFLAAKGRVGEADQLAARLGVERAQASAPAQATGEFVEKVDWRDVISILFRGRYLLATLCFVASLFCGMLLIYGLNTWLPQIMRKAGYDLSSSLSMLIVYSLSSAIGGIVLGKIADLTSVKGSIAAAFLLGAAGIFLLSMTHSTHTAYFLLVLAGFGSISSSQILTCFVATYYPAYARSAATGWVLSLARFGAVAGPMIGGYAEQLNIPLPWHFGIFALAGVVASVAALLIPTRGRVVTHATP